MTGRIALILLLAAGCAAAVPAAHRTHGGFDAAGAVAGPGSAPGVATTGEAAVPDAPAQEPCFAQRLHAWFADRAPSFHGGGPGGPHGGAAVRGFERCPLDDVDLDPPVRARAREIVRAHHERALGLHEKVQAGEISHEEALAEHGKIVASAHEALAPLLTEEQMGQLRKALHSTAK